MSRLFDNELNRDPMDAYYEIKELKSENKELRELLTQLHAQHLSWDGSEYWDKPDHEISQRVGRFLHGDSQGFIYKAPLTPEQVRETILEALGDVETTAFVVNHALMHFIATIELTTDAPGSDAGAAVENNPDLPF